VPALVTGAGLGGRIDVLSGRVDEQVDRHAA
jgi:hypothetical protein